jgi:hypothetical protein
MPNRTSELTSQADLDHRREHLRSRFFAGSAFAGQGTHLNIEPLVPGIQPTACSGARFALDPGNPGRSAGAGKGRDEAERSIGAGPAAYSTDPIDPQGPRLGMPVAWNAAGG